MDISKNDIMFITYAIYNSEKDKIYIGQTADLDKRMARHNHILPNRKNSYTSRNPGFWKVVYQEEHFTRNESLQREKALKSERGRGFVRSLIDNMRP
jgi:putative endonuclease